MKYVSFAGWGGERANHQASLQIVAWGLRGSIGDTPTACCCSFDIGPGQDSHRILFSSIHVCPGLLRTTKTRARHDHDGPACVQSMRVSACGRARDVSCSRRAGRAVARFSGGRAAAASGFGASRLGRAASMLGRAASMRAYKCGALTSEARSSVTGRPCVFLSPPSWRRT